MNGSSWRGLCESIIVVVVLVVVGKDIHPIVLETIAMATTWIMDSTTPMSDGGTSIKNPT